MVLIALSVLCGCGSESSDSRTPQDDAPPALTPLPAVELPAYEFIANNGPIVILMAMDMHTTLYTNSMGGVVSDLLSAGFSLLALDLPCHGTDATEPAKFELVCWRKRIEGGDTEMFRRFCSGLSLVLDQIGATEASVVGQSRGGYVGVTCAAYDDRIRNIALLSPVTDLQRLTEFDGYAVDQHVFGLAQFAPYIVDRHIMIRIAADDSRVGTEAAVTFGHLVNADIRLVDFVGHVPPEDGSTTAWLLEQHHGPTFVSSRKETPPLSVAPLIGLSMMSISAAT